MIFPTASLISGAANLGSQLEKLKQATNGIEGIFVKNLLSEMQKGTHMFGEGPGSDIYQDLINQSLAQNIGQRGSLGISEMLYHQLSPRLIAQAEAQVRLGAKAGGGS